MNAESARSKVWKYSLQNVGLYKITVTYKTQN